MNETGSKKNNTLADRVIRCCLFAFIFSSCFSVFLSNFFIYLALTIFFVMVPFSRRRLKYDKIYSFMLLFVAANIFAHFYGGGKLSNISAIKNVMCFLIFVIAYEKGRLLPNRLSFITLMLFSNALLLFLAIALTAAGCTDVSYFSDFASWADGYSGLFSITITYGEFLVMLLCVALTLLADCYACFTGVCSRAVMPALTIINVFALLLTHSRGPWAAMALCTFVILLLSRHKKYAAVFGVSLLLFLGLVLSPAAKDVPFLSDINERLTLTLKGYSSGRETIYAVAFEMIKTRPWLGLGIGGVEKNYSAYVDKIEWASPERKKMVYGHLHNVYLQIWAECGIPGLAAFLCLMGYTVLKLWRKYKSMPDTDRDAAVDKSFVKGALVAIVSMCVMGFSEYNFFDSETSRIMWFYAGIAFSAGEVKKTGSALSDRI